MELKDYLHFYEGALCRWRYVDYSPGQWSVLASLTKRDIARLCDDNSVEKIELHLRPLSDMTHEEWNECAKYARTGSGIRTAGDLWKMNAEETRYLLSRHFDLFCLIDLGLAIDKTKQ